MFESIRLNTGRFKTLPPSRVQVAQPWVKLMVVTQILSPKKRTSYDQTNSKPILKMRMIALLGNTNIYPWMKFLMLKNLNLHPKCSNFLFFYQIYRILRNLYVKNWYFTQKLIHHILAELFPSPKWYNLSSRHH